MYFIKLALIFFWIAIFSLDALTQVNVTIDYKTQMFIGTVSKFDRNKYILLHDWSDTDSDINKFKTDFNLGLGGRGFWGPFSYAKNQTGEVGKYLSSKGDNNTSIRKVKREVATEHPGNVYRLGLDKIKAAEWVVEYYKNYMDDGNVPEYFEVMNEPFVHANDFGPDDETIRREMAELYASIGNKIHETPELKNMKVLGYASAWPSLELMDFEHWESRMKMFMDVAGEHMDAISLHLYDIINTTGEKSFRSGSNTGAILDLIETYSFFKWGFVKPLAITEYGTIVETEVGSNWSSLINGRGNVGQNQLLMDLLDREDRLEISIPFTTGKSIWHINETNNCQPYMPSIMVPENIGDCIPLGWDYTPRLNFYKIWKDVSGERVMIKSDNIDIQTQAFVEDNKLSIILCNVDDKIHEVNLNYSSELENLTTVKIKSLKTYDDEEAVYQEINYTEKLSKLYLIPAEIVVIEYGFNDIIEYEKILRTNKYYNINHLVSISGIESFEFNNIDLGVGGGYANLRLSVGRNNDQSVIPDQIILNGESLEIPQNWEGYDQVNRDGFFGTIEISVPFDKLKINNEFQIGYNDPGGKISSVILDVELFSDEIVGINNKKINYSDGIKIYPTLVDNDYFKIDINSNRVFNNVEIYSMSGELVRQISINNPRTVFISTSGMTKGMYLVKLCGSHNSLTAKVVLK